MNKTAPKAQLPPMLRGERRLIRGAALTIVLLVIWAAVFELDIAAQAPGEVAPLGQVKRIQHLEGGIVREIFVREGETVTLGQPLVELESTTPEADLRELRTRIAILTFTKLRLEAQLTRAGEIPVPAELAKAYPEQVAGVRALFTAQKERLTNALETQKLRIAQRRAELAEAQARIDNLQSRHRLVSAQMAIKEKLLQKGLANEYESLELRKEDQTINGSLQESRSALERIAATLKQEEFSLTALTLSEEEAIRKELVATQKELAEFSERILKYQDSRARTTIRSPIDGIVMTLYTVTRGGVIAPGGTILSLVPSGDRLVIEARLPVGEVGFVHPGQSARLQLAGAGSRGFAPMTGSVVHISPDSLNEPQKDPYYLVRITPEQEAFVQGSHRYPLTPGVRVQAAILTGRRSVLATILDPFLVGFRNTLTER
ncbi:MAG: HlyD family type I secretion periplasmic adaptor subunit [Magnetococcales bacterium]|nr:HlyD family type I secretion periplasmic adaptor subunit [Magnetococcales bacterium]